MLTISWPKPDLAVVRINRADRGNAFDARLVKELHAAIVEVTTQPTAQTLVFLAEGKDFSTGMDLSHLDAETDETLAARFFAIEELLAAVWSSRLRTVVCVQGRAWGAAADLAVACDLRLSSPNASFRFPGAQFGLVLGTRRLSCRIGSDMARQIILEGQTVLSERAVKLGLIHRVVDTFDLEHLPALVVTPEIQAMIHRASRAADGNHTEPRPDLLSGADPSLQVDFQALAQSMRRPGLRQRMRDYSLSLRQGTVASRPEAQ